MKYSIETLKRKMLVKYPCFGSVVANVDYKEEKGIPTAATDRKTIYYNPVYLDGLDLDEQIFVFAHEVSHIAFNHILRSEGKDPRLWNIATDAVINQFLKKDGLKLVSGGVDIAEAIYYDAEQFYEKLLQEQQEQQQQNGQDNSQNQKQSQSDSKDQSGSGSNGSQNQDQNEQQNQQSSGDSSNSEQQKEQDSSREDVGHDTHSLWREAVKRHKEEQNNSSGEKEQSEIEKTQEELEKMGEKAAFKKNRDDYKKQLEELKQSLARQSASAGTSTDKNIRTIEDIGTAKPLIDWRRVLREAMKYEVDWSYKNASIEDGVIEPHLEKQPMAETEIVLDTSGSINSNLLKNFLRECKNILRQSRLKVGCFDTEFYGFHVIRTEADIENMTFEGGGGTNFNVAVGAFSRRVENKIIFTDGKSSMPDMPMNAVWIVFGSRKINPKGGKVIHITKEELDRLTSYEIENETKGRSR